MEIEDKGLPIKEDAELKIRPRIFLEGNFFVDLEPGSPSAERARRRAARSRSPRPPRRSSSATCSRRSRATRAPTSRRSCASTRRASTSGGAEGFNESIQYWEPAYRNSSLANDATLGQDADRDLQRVLRGQQKTFAALAQGRARAQGPRHELQRRRPARSRARTWRSPPRSRRCATRCGSAQPGARVARTPRCRRCARSRATPCRACARSDETLDGVAAVHPPGAPADVRARAARDGARAAPDDPGRRRRSTATSVPFLRESARPVGLHEQRARPVQGPRDPEPRVGNEAENSDQKVRAQLQRGFPGLAGESRLSDGNNQYFHAGASPPGDRVRPGPPPDGGSMPLDAPPRRAVRDPGAAEPARARRPDPGLPGARAEPPARRSSRPRRRRRVSDFLDAAAELRGRRAAAGPEGAHGVRSGARRELAKRRGGR